jgi:hypothetical protein
MIVGQDFKHYYNSWEDGTTRYTLRFDDKNFVGATLQPGQTYYYRTFAEVKVQEDGQEEHHLPLRGGEKVPRA